MMRLHFRKHRKILVASFSASLILVILSLGGDELAKPADRHEKDRQLQKTNVVAERFNFTPSKIKVKQGKLLEITLTSEDTFHGFRIPSANINQIIPARGRGSIKVVFEAK